MFGRIRAAWAALTTPAASSASTPAPSTGPDTHIPHPNDYPTPDAWAAAAMAAAEHMRATEETRNSVRDVQDDGRALQARDIRNVSMDTHTHEDTHHHGGTVTNNNHGTVGLQAGHIKGGVVNVGGNNSFTNTAIGNGANVNYVGTNNGGQVLQADHITGGVSFGDPHR